jgi:hypothetical protein
MLLLTDLNMIPSIAHSEKGWTDNKIGVLYIKDFDAKTCEKAQGQYRLLIVDGHNSHYSREFLEYARANKIVVLCYPAHATHVYQGLDVVIFGPLKKNWSRERDRHERETGEKVSKQNFLLVYGAAHAQTLTPQNICAAFAKTGFGPSILMLSLRI